jgi:hypothetical protein
MKFEVIETGGEWIVRCNGAEVARFNDQLAALAEVTGRLRDAEERDASYSLAMRYAARG